MVNANVNAMINSTSVFSFYASVPIVGWSSNIQMSSDTDTRVVAMQVGLEGGNQSVGTNSPIKFDTVLSDTHAAYSTSTGLYTVPISGYYRVSGNLAQTGTVGGTYSVYKNGSAYAFLVNYLSSSAVAAGSLTVKCNAGDTLGIYTNNAITAESSSAPANLMSIERLSGPSVIAATESVNAVYSDNSGGSIGTSSSVYTFNTKQRDTHNAYSGGTYTIPVSGLYTISANIETNGLTLSTTQQLQLYIVHNGTNIATNYIIGNGASNAWNANITGSWPCLAGDTIQIKAVSGVATTANSGSPNQFSIFRAGN